MGSLDNSFGAILIGLIAGSVLFGLSTLQTYLYFQSYSHDSVWMKRFVAALWCTDAIHEILCTHAIYYYLVTNFGNTPALQVEIWSMALQTMSNTIIGVAVQLFFARRVLLLTRQKVVTALITTSALIHFSLGIYFTVKVFVLKEFLTFRSLTWVTCVGLGNAALADVVIAFTMVYYLRGVRTGIPHTDSVITTLIVYAVNTGAVTSLIATICVICFAFMPTNLIWLAFYWTLCKLYANSLLANLNNRDVLRRKTSNAVDNNNVTTPIPFTNLSTVSRVAFASKSTSDQPVRVNVTKETFVVASDRSLSQNSPASKDPLKAGNTLDLRPEYVGTSSPRKKENWESSGGRGF